MGKSLTACILAALLIGWSDAANADIGWAGFFPCGGSKVLEGTSPQITFVIDKAGTTDSPGQGSGISASLFYGSTSNGPWEEIAMFYSHDDEYVHGSDVYFGYIPASALYGQREIWTYCRAYDDSDGTIYDAGDACSGNLPVPLDVYETIEQDVTVWFSLCVPDELHGVEICITGNHPALTDLGTGVQLERPCPQSSPGLYQVAITFPAGSNRSVEYQYLLECSQGESCYHNFSIDDTTPTMMNGVDNWGCWTVHDCEPCAVAVEKSTWGRIKTLYK